MGVFLGGCAHGSNVAAADRLSRLRRHIKQCRVRHLLVLALIAALLAAGYFLLVPRTSMVQGRVVLNSLDGEETPGAGARVAAYPATAVDDALRGWLGEFDESRASSRLEVQAARRVWSQLTARRDEAARILRVAERANAADLDICRARHREAAADAEDALRRLAQLEAGYDETVDPVRFAAALPPPIREAVAGADGTFRMEVPRGGDLCLVARWSKNLGAGETVVWLRASPLEDGEDVQFSNANVLTAEKLAEAARARKKPESRAGSPAQ